MANKITALIILDGFGVRQETEGNAIKISGIPHISELMKKYPNTTLGASGMAVGLPEGQMGNSEVGHLNIGAGRIVYQELTRITKSIKDGDFFEKQEFLDAIANVTAHKSSLHLFGLISDGGVHSHQEHLYALLELARRNGLQNVYIHCFMDGRDVPPMSGKDFILQLEDEMKRIGTGKIATVMGRYYAMDRDNRWERVILAYDAMTSGIGRTARNAAEAMQQSYDEGDTDEFVKPTIVVENGKPVATIGKNDSIIFFNFRPDRAREITRSFIEEDFSGFERKKGYFPVFYVCFTQYDKTFQNVHTAFKPSTLENTFGEYISKQNKTQLRIAETEKYAHVTFFFNGGIEKPYPNEDRVLIPSPKVATYDLKPEMSACEVATEAEKRVLSGNYDVMILNFANPDMVGHTGVLEAAVQAVDTVDQCVGCIIEAVLQTGGEAIVTADHGNAEIMIDPETGEPFTAHSTDRVPFILVSERFSKCSLRNNGILADIAPTMLELMGMEKPAEMTGKSLIIK